MNIVKEIFKIFAQYKCVSCDDDSMHMQCICNSCLAHIDSIKQEMTCKKCGRACDKDLCFFCNKEMPKFTQAKTYCIYNDVSAAIIKNYKYYNNGLCKNFISQKLKEIYENEFANAKIDFIVPVPMNGMKEWVRGYNHCGQIAKKAFAGSGAKILPFGLHKKFTLKKQAGSGRMQRLLNMKDVFFVNKKYNFEGMNVLLIDDTITTGATIFECTKVLFKNGAANVFVLTFAKSIADEEMMQNLKEENY